MVTFIYCDKEESIISEVISELYFVTVSESKPISFNTNNNWEVSILNNVSWVSVSPQKGGPGNNNITVTVSENRDYDEREAVLTIKSDNSRKEIKITQQKKEDIIIEEDEFNFDYDGGNFEVEVQTNVELKVTIPGDVNWVRYLPSSTRALNTVSLQFEVDKSTAFTDRETIITISDQEDKIVRTIKVVQNESHFKDARDSKVYKTVRIGTQVWMAENLAYLPSVSAPDKGSDNAPHYYVYGYNGSDVNAAKATFNYATYGVLYNWAAAMNGSSNNSSNSTIQGVCPNGWHLPDDADWDSLAEFMGGKSLSGEKLRESGTTHWKGLNSYSTNDFDFTALPGGYRYNYGTFYTNGSRGHWWSATQYDSSLAWYRLIYYDKKELDKNYINKGVGFSVRCVRD